MSSDLRRHLVGEGEKSDEWASEGYVVQNIDAETVRQLRMGLGFCIVFSDLLLCRLGCIVLAGLYLWIV